MSTAASIFPRLPTTPASHEPASHEPDATKVIETVGVEVLDEPPRSASNESQAPANGNGLVPFASTLRRVG